MEISFFIYSPFFRNKLWSKQGLGVLTCTAFRFRVVAPHYCFPSTYLFVQRGATTSCLKGACDLRFHGGTYKPAQWLRCCATNRKIAGSIPAGVSGFFIDIKSFRSRYGLGVDSASNRNEYQEYFLVVKAAGA